MNFIRCVSDMKVAKLITELYRRFRNLILYGIIGGFCSALDFVIYTVLCHYDVLPYLWANVISVHIGIFTSFILNRQLNFKIKDKTPQRFLSFYLVGLTGLGISSLMLYLMVDYANWNEIVCKLITIIVVALVQFFLNKYITFKPTQK
jgi:putative flippase GtrA